MTLVTWIIILTWLGWLIFLTLTENDLKRPKMTKLTKRLKWRKDERAKGRKWKKKWLELTLNDLKWCEGHTF